MSKPEIVINDIDAGHKIMKLAGGAVFNQLGETCIARYHDGKLLGGMVYSNYSGVSCEMHVAGFAPRWINRDILWVAFDYPFSQMGCRKVFGRVQASNNEALRFNLSLGFEIEATLKDVYADGDMHVMSMYREKCRHLNIRPRGIKRNERP